MLALDIELKYNPIRRLFNKQVVPGELNKYEERAIVKEVDLSQDVFLLATCTNSIIFCRILFPYIIRLMQKNN